MAISAAAIDNAEYTFTDDINSVRDDTGALRQQRVENPWCFIRFADPSEPNRYVMPINGCAVVFNGQLLPKVWISEIMPYQPFPLETARPARNSDSRDSNNLGGPFAIHFYGWI